MCIRDRSLPQYWGELADTMPNCFNLKMVSDGGAETSVTNVIRPRPNSPTITNSNNVNTEAVTTSDQM